jgi:hypothetical protein
VVAPQACEAAYVWANTGTPFCLTSSAYCVAVAVTFHVYVGRSETLDPCGATKVVASGDVGVSLSVHP